MRLHKTSTFFAAVILCVSLNACASPNPPQSTTAQTDTNKSFPSATSLTKEFFKKYALGISSNTFNARWDNSLENELIFFRSHVRAYYAITQNLAPPNTPIDYCLGDAHVANFGFLEGKDSKARYLYNDLDDSGKCPIALDALRYFTSVQLAEDPKLAQELVNYYSQVLNGNAVATQIPESLFPNFEAVRKKLIRKMFRRNKSFASPILSKMFPKILSPRLESLLQMPLQKRDSPTQKFSTWFKPSGKAEEVLV